MRPTDRKPGRAPAGVPAQGKGRHEGLQEREGPPCLSGSPLACLTEAGQQMSRGPEEQTPGKTGARLGACLANEVELRNPGPGGRAGQRRPWGSRA